MPDSAISQALKKLNYGIYIVTSRKPAGELTTRNADWVAASTISWLTQSSAEPATVVMAVQKDSNLAETIQRSGNFAVHLLGEDDRELVKEFVGPADFNEEQVNGHRYTEGESGAPILASAGFGHFECRTVETVSLEGDHHLIIGRVISGKVTDAKAEPLALEQSSFEYEGDK